VAGLLVALTEHAINARTEGFDRIIKQVKRVACGFPITVTRPRLQKAG
jgi:hypothetical protein